MTTGLKEAILQLKEAILGPCSHWQKKKRAAVLPREDWIFFLGRIPTLARARQGSDAGQVARPGFYARRGRHQAAEPSQSPGPLLYVLYVLYLTRQATEHPLSPGSLLYVLYVLYLTRQATEHPLFPGSLLYVLYVLYLTRQATEHPLSPGSLLYVLYVLYGPI